MQFTIFYMQLTLYCTRAGWCRRCGESI